MKVKKGNSKPNINTDEYTYDKDAYLPTWLCVFGAGLLVVAQILFILTMTTDNYVFGVVGVPFLGVGIAALLCWKNQWIVMLSDEEFLYSTMFGRKKKYRFSEIEDLKIHNDSKTLVLKNGKVHIENSAMVSGRFANAINMNRTLQKKRRVFRRWN